MRISELFTKTLKQDPHGEVSVNAMLLERAGFVYKNSAGVYTYLPLGWRVINKISDIVREEMNAIGGLEFLMPALVEKRYWDTTGRWDIDIAFKIKSSHGNFALGWSHEEVISEIAKRYLSSYKDLPKAVYQIQDKFRDEPRARSGLIRGREFIMKDLYSFHIDEDDLDKFYKKVMRAYEKIAKRCGIDAIWVEAGGGPFTESITHELQVLTSSGEDTIFICSSCKFAKNKEIIEESKTKCPKCKKEWKQERGIEVGNVFKLGTRFSKAFNLTYRDKKGNLKPVVMGSYGIGIPRLMATIVEVSHDKDGIIWPESVAPLDTYLLGVENKPKVKKKTEELYAKITKEGKEVLYDDRWHLSAGEKFTDADLIGLPKRIVVSENLLSKNKAELKLRNSKKVELIPL